ncbi:MAG: sugar-binding protein [Chloroflexota bacterium]
MRVPITVPSLLLVAAALACNLPGGAGPNTAATLDAAVTQTVTFQPIGSVNTAAPSATLQPPIGVTLQWPTDTPAPTSAAPLPPSTPAPTQELTRPNGSPVHALRFAAPPVIDGDVGEWGALTDASDQIVYKPANWSGVGDTSGAFKLAWDDSALYLAVKVVDEHLAQTQSGELIFKGDSVEALFDGDLGGDYSEAKLSADDFQLGFSPGNLATGDPAAQAYLWFPRDRAGQPAGVAVAAQALDVGYQLEAAIPWTVFGIAPAGGDRFGFALSISDNDNPAAAEQESMVSSVSTRKLTNPTTWGTLILDN